MPILAQIPMKIASFLRNCCSSIIQAYDRCCRTRRRKRRPKNAAQGKKGNHHSDVHPHMQQTIFVSIFLIPSGYSTQPRSV